MFSFQTLHVTCEVGTLAVDGWAVTLGTARRGLGGVATLPRCMKCDSGHFCAMTISGCCNCYTQDFYQLSVRLSVRPSVTRRYCVKTAKRILKLLAATPFQFFLY